MPEQILFPGVLLPLLTLTLILSRLLAEIMQHCLVSAVALLEQPAKLLQPRTGRTTRLFLLLFPLYSLSTCLTAGVPELLVSWIFVAFMAFISIIDLEQQLIPDTILVLVLVLALCFSPFLPAPLPDRLLAAIGGGGLLLLLAVLTKGGIGGGDIKLLFVLGLWLGTTKLLFTLCTGFIGGGLAAALLLLSRTRKRRDTFAYGPYFALSAIAAFLL